MTIANCKLQIDEPCPQSEVAPAYEYTTDWVTWHEPVWRELLAGFADRPVTGLEIGCWEGRSVCWWLLNICVHRDSRLTCIDPFGIPAHRERFLHNVALTGSAHKLRVMAGRSWDLLHLVPDNDCDWVYVDGSHEARDVLLDGLLALRKVRVAGILIFDDYRWQDPDSRRHHLPGPGIDAFLALNDWCVEVVHRGYQLAVRRTA